MQGHSCQKKAIATLPPPPPPSALCFDLSKSVSRRKICGNYWKSIADRMEYSRTVTGPPPRVFVQETRKLLRLPIKSIFC